MTTSLYGQLKRRYQPLSIDERRRFLRDIVAMGTASLLPQRLGMAASSPRRAIVVGAGLAGLACAHELRVAGVDVQVLEARQRVGGRVLSLDDFVADGIVEGGGEFIGENHPTWWAYGERFALDFQEVFDDADLETPICIAGRRLSPAEGREIFEQMETAFASLTSQAASIDPQSPWLSPQAKELDAQSIAHWLDPLNLSTQAKLMIDIQLSSDNAIANRCASWLGMLAAVQGGGGDRYWECSETHRCVGGNQRLARKLAEAIGASRIHFRQILEKIDTSGPVARLTMSDGRLWECDDIVLAIPPSVWPSIHFEPSLPSVLAPQMGKAIKYLASVRTRAWLARGDSANSLSDGPISQTWETRSAIANPESSTCLAAFSGADQAERCLRIPVDQRDRRYREELGKLFPTTELSWGASRMMDWTIDPWTRAGYSFPAVGQVTSQGPLLESGIGNLHFCGEHTCYRFIGYMEGALHSGVALARRLVRS